jgi:hypothetical protein
VDRPRVYPRVCRANALKIKQTQKINPTAFNACENGLRMKTQARPINSHRLARGIRWAQAMLAWLALLLCTDIVRTDRRHIRQRYGRIRRLHQIERFLAALLINRAVEIAPLPKHPGRPSRNAAPAGFRRRLVHKPSFRVMLGSRLRKALRHRDLLQRLQRLWAAFADIDALARRYVVPRVRCRLTRICPILITAPPTVAVGAPAALAIAAADSS